MGEAPVVISQMQTHDNRTQFVSTRHYVPVPAADPERHYFVPEEARGWVTKIPPDHSYEDMEKVCLSMGMIMASIHSPAEEADAIAAMDAANVASA